MRILAFVVWGHSFMRDQFLKGTRQYDSALSQSATLWQLYRSTAKTDTILIGHFLHFGPGTNLEVIWQWFEVTFKYWTFAEIESYGDRAPYSHIYRINYWKHLKHAIRIWIIHLSQGFGMQSIRSRMKNLLTKQESTQ